MAYLTERQLMLEADNFSTQRTRGFIKESATLASVTIFLSHSHKDKQMVLGLIALLAKAGVTVYVDWNDSTMPRITNRQTADQIKVQIGRNHIFMVLATKNACESKWVPWEIGVADEKKGTDRILLIPVADPTGTFHGNEYLQLYRHVELEGMDDLKVWEVGDTYGFSKRAVADFMKARRS